MYNITLKAKYTNLGRNLIQTNTSCETKYQFLARLIYKWFINKANRIFRFDIPDSWCLTRVHYDQCDADNESYYHMWYNCNYDNSKTFDILVELKKSVEQETKKKEVELIIN